jgi:asparagine synthase (glutamine-hydrolysing)
MCAINGFTWHDEQLIAAMNDQTKHRGPDGDGVFVDGDVSLGHRRLAIIDLSQRAAQPMATEDGRYQLVFNGEIYNFQDIRARLENMGHKFFSNSDSEVVLRSYAQFGAECVKEFNGMFAFAIWDVQQKSLFLARDRVGIKPLYYFHDGDRFIFSSEIKAILAHDIPRRLNMDALNIYLRMLYVPAPMTMFEKIFKLEPGTTLTYCSGHIDVQRYWSHARTSEQLPEAEIVKKIHDVLYDSVQRRLISDRPVGVFLSGGVDSTAVAGIAAEQTSGPLKTFSVDFDVRHEKFNTDAAVAKKTSARLGSDHHEFMVTGNDCAVHFSDVIRAMDEPVANTTQIATYLLSKHTREHVVVALGGDGGDELFGGYDRYKLAHRLHGLRVLPESIRRAVMQTGSRLWPQKKGVFEKLIHLSGVTQYMSFMAQKEEHVSRVLRSQINDPQVTPTHFERYVGQRGNDVVASMMGVDVQSWLPDESLIRTDKMSMAFGLEARVPILDHRLVELSLQIPSRMQLNGTDMKILFKKAVAPYLSPEVLAQPKRGWFSPTSEWLRGPLGPMAEDLLSPSFCSQTSDLFDFSAIQTMFTNHLDRKEYQMNLIWALMTFQQWYYHYML